MKAWFGRLTPWVLGVVSVAFDHPIPRFQCLLSSGQILLSQERLLIGCDFGEIFATSVHRLCYRREADACKELVLGRGCCAFGLLAEVQAVALVALCRRYAVGTEQHLRAAVLTVLAGFTQCARYGINTGAPFYMCHVKPIMFYLRLA